MSARADLRDLVLFGSYLDHHSVVRHITFRQALTEELLRVRDKRGHLIALRPNRAQFAFDAACQRRNIVLKARQLGITTWIAARFFLNTITHPGTVSVQVAHDQTSAEEIFRIVHRFLENLPAKAGNNKKDAALSFVSSALSLTEALANKDVIDQQKFTDGIGKIIDGTVQCLNASAWAKKPL